MSAVRREFIGSLESNGRASASKDYSIAAWLWALGGWKGSVKMCGKSVVRNMLALAVSQTPLCPGATAGDARLRDATAQPDRVCRWTPKGR